MQPCVMFGWFDYFIMILRLRLFRFWLTWWQRILSDKVTLHCKHKWVEVGFGLIVSDLDVVVLSS